MAQFVGSRSQRPSLDPNLSFAGSSAAHKSRARSSPTSGTRRSTQTRRKHADGLQILVQSDGDAEAEQHEMEDHPNESLESIKGEPYQERDRGPTEPARHDGSNTRSQAESLSGFTSVLRHRNIHEARGDNDSDSNFSESNMTVQRKNLTTFDVAALIFNKMVSLIDGSLNLYAHL
jgi:hypothetical protein